MGINSHFSAKSGLFYLARLSRYIYTDHMSEKPDNIVLEHLRHIRSRVGDLHEDVRDVKLRLTHVEENLAMVNRRMDKFDGRLERLERRLGLVDGVIAGWQPGPCPYLHSDLVSSPPRFLGAGHCRVCQAPVAEISEVASDTSFLLLTGGWPGYPDAALLELGNNTAFDFSDDGIELLSGTLDAGGIDPDNPDCTAKPKCLG